MSLLVPNMCCPSLFYYHGFETVQGQNCSGHETLEADSEKLSILGMKTLYKLKQDSCSCHPTDTTGHCAVLGSNCDLM